MNVVYVDGGPNTPARHALRKETLEGTFYAVAVITGNSQLATTDLSSVDWAPAKPKHVSLETIDPSFPLTQKGILTKRTR